MKLADFLQKYNGDISVYQRQFASADDSVDDLLDCTDLNPKSVANINNNNNKPVEAEKTSNTLPSSSSPPRKRHSDEENLESADTLAPLPKTVASKRTLPAKFETPAADRGGGGGGPSTSCFETPAGRQPLVACTPSNTRAPRRSEVENPNLASKLILYKESKTGSPLAQDLSDMGTPELRNIQAQIDRMMKMKTK